MPSIRDTAVEMTQFVLPEHAGAPGQIHGGRMEEQRDRPRHRRTGDAADRKGLLALAVTG